MTKEFINQSKCINQRTLCVANISKLYSAKKVHLVQTMQVLQLCPSDKQTWIAKPRKHFNNKCQQQVSKEGHCVGALKFLLTLIPIEAKL